jgi:hypothetical protein
VFSLGDLNRNLLFAFDEELNITTVQAGPFKYVNEAAKAETQGSGGEDEKVQPPALVGYTTLTSFFVYVGHGYALLDDPILIMIWAH